jgi:hypothetical protein
MVKTVEPDDVAAGIVAALESPRARVYVPRVGAGLAKAQQVIPRRMMQRLSTALGGKSAFLEDVDPASRKAYEDRARQS